MPDELKIPVVWIEPEDTEIIFVNQMVVQRQGDEYVLTFGQQTPPIVLGEDETEVFEQAKKIPFIAVRTAVRIGMSQNRMKEFATVIGRFMSLQETVQK